MSAVTINDGVGHEEEDASISTLLAPSFPFFSSFLFLAAAMYARAMGSAERGVAEESGAAAIDDSDKDDNDDDDDEEEVEEDGEIKGCRVKHFILMSPRKATTRSRGVSAATTKIRSNTNLSKAK